MQTCSEHPGYDFAQLQHIHYH